MLSLPSKFSTSTFTKQQIQGLGKRGQGHQEVSPCLTLLYLINPLFILMGYIFLSTDKENEMHNDTRNYSRLQDDRWQGLDLNPQAVSN